MNKEHRGERAVGMCREQHGLSRWHGAARGVTEHPSAAHRSAPPPALVPNYRCAVTDAVLLQITKLFNCQNVIEKISFNP